MKLYDCFQFFNEYDLLEIRLELLYDHIDYFVISETNRTHSNNPKPYYFEENKHLFEKYMDKIIHIKSEYPEDILHFVKKDASTAYNRQYNRISDIYDKEESEGELKMHPTFCRDFLQREFIKFGLLDCQDDDLIMVSDLDEIPNPDVVKIIKEKRLTEHCVMQDCYYYYINILAHTNWYGNYIVEYSKTKDVSLTHLRNDRVGYIKLDKSGWHFSFMGGIDRVINKLESYAHQEFNQQGLKDMVLSRINQNKDILWRSNQGTYNTTQEFYFDDMKVIDLKEFPEKMINIIETKFKYLIK